MVKPALLVLLVVGACGAAGGAHGDGTMVGTVQATAFAAGPSQVDSSYGVDGRLMAQVRGPVLAYARLDASNYGTDHRAGDVGAELGYGLGGRGLVAGLFGGLGYGGMPRSAMNLPIRLAVGVAPSPSLGGMASFYVGPRWGGDAPAGTSTTYGVNADVIIKRGLPWCIGLGWDSQDDESTVSLRLGVGLATNTSR